MENIKALVVQNPLNLPDKVAHGLLERVNRREVAYLSPEKEAAPFLFYCLGDDFKKIALKANYPIEVIMLTAMYYKWPEKKEVLQKAHVDMVPREIQKDITNSLLVATYMTVQRQLADVMANRKKAEDCPLIPNNMLALEKLMMMIEQLGKPPRDPNVPAAAGTVISANNVQVNQGVPSESKPQEPAVNDKSDTEKQAMLESLEGE
jgi:hypothetical protein